MEINKKNKINMSFHNISEQYRIEKVFLFYYLQKVVTRDIFNYWLLNKLQLASFEDISHNLQTKMSLEGKWLCKRFEKSKNSTKGPEKKQDCFRI